MKHLSVAWILLPCIQGLSTNRFIPPAEPCIVPFFLLVWRDNINLLTQSGYVLKRTFLNDELSEEHSRSHKFIIILGVLTLEFRFQFCYEVYFYFLFYAA